MMRGTGRPIIVPKEVLEAPLRVPNAFKNQNKPVVTNPLNTSGTSTDSGVGQFSSSPPKPKNDANGLDGNSNRKFESVLNKLDILFSGPMEDLVIYRILDVVIFKDSRTEEDLKAIATHIANKTLTDSSNIIPISKYMFLFSLLPEKGSPLRTMFFTRLQKVFEERHRSLSQPEYVNFVRLLQASVFYNRNPNDRVADFFILSCLTVLQEMTNMTKEDDVEAQVELFVRCAEHTQNSSSDLKDKFFQAKNVIRNLIGKESLTIRARQWLMFALECSGGVISPDTLKYYSEKLGPEKMNTLAKTDFKYVIPKSDASRFPIGSMKMGEFVTYI